MKIEGLSFYIPVGRTVDQGRQQKKGYEIKMKKS
jgi:hypothetical protein